jgi:hypothetical protein
VLFQHVDHFEHDHGGVEDSAAAVLPFEWFAFSLAAMLLPLDELYRHAAVAEQSVEEAPATFAETGVLLSDHG